MLAVVGFGLLLFGLGLLCSVVACIWISSSLPTQLVGILARLRRHRTLTWCTRGGSPACALNAWLRSRGWSFDAEWKWTHADTGHTLNLNDDGHHGEDGFGSTWFVTLGMLGACTVTCRLLVVILRWIVSMPVTSRESIGLRPVLGLLRARKLVLFVLVRFSPLLSVVAAGPVS